MKSKVTSLVLVGVMALAGTFGLAASATATAAPVLDAAAPWVEVPRLIPIYVNGELVGYVISYEWVWIPTEEP